MKVLGLRLLRVLPEPLNYERQRPFGCFFFWGGRGRGCAVLGHHFSYSGRLGMVLGLGFKFRVRWAAGVGSRVYRLIWGSRV